MDHKDRRLQRILHILVIIYIATLLYGFYLNWQLRDYNALGMGAIACVTPLIVPVIFKLCKFKPVY